nr:pentatricopeptide repeat-containing protein At4g20090 [Ipomoea batatas]
MPFSASASKHLSLGLSPNPCKFFCHFNLIPRCFSSLPKPSEPEHEPEKDQTLIQDSPKSDCYGTRREQPPIADKLFKLAPKSGSYKQGDSTFYSLIENYANSGDFGSLEKVFDRMKREKRVFVEKSFILVFRAYGKARLPDKAVELFERMVDEFQCRRTVRPFNSVLNVIIQAGLHHRALKFIPMLLNVDRRGVEPNVLTFNLIVKAMCKVGMVDRAVQVFREMPEWECKRKPDVYTYCTSMDGLCKDDRIDEAVTLLDEMQIEGCFPIPVTFNVLINGLCKKGNLGRAAKLVENMFLKGCVPNEVTYNTLIHGLCLKGKLDKAISLLHRMVSNKHVPNDITYGTIINGLVKQGRAVDGACICRAMEERGHRAKEGKSEEVLKLWNEMIEKGSKPNTIVYSALIDGLCRDGRPDEAQEILLQMIKMDCTPNAWTYSSLMKGFFKIGKSNEAILVWKDMVDQNILPNEVCYSVLIHGLCGDGKLKEAMMVWKQMITNGWNPDVVAYTSMIYGLCNAGSVEQGLKFFHEMLRKESNSQPDVVTYSTLFNALCKQDRISRAIDLLNNMLDQGCDPDLVTCNIFLTILNEKLSPPQSGGEFLDELVLRLHKRQNSWSIKYYRSDASESFIP